jgi:glutathione S-transferase
MYTLYCLPDACSLATHTLLIELGQPVQLVHRDDAPNFHALNPVGSVPALDTGDALLTEGAAINLYLLQRYPSGLWPTGAERQRQALQDIMFANATMHPAYSRLFFIKANIADEASRLQALQRAADAINKLWAVLDQRLADQPFLGGMQPGAADIMLAVYARWGAFFPVDIQLGHATQRLLRTIEASASFQRALTEQQALLTKRDAA